MTPEPARGRTPAGTAYAVAGDGEPLVLVHGVGMRADAWAPQRDALSRTHRVVCYDLLGHGDSALPPEGATLSDYAAQLAELLDHLGLASAGVVGHSMGALVALEHAIAVPDRCTRVAALNAVYRRSPAQRAAVQGRLAALESDGVSATVAPTLARWFGDPVPAALASAHAAARACLAAADPVGYRRTYAVFATADDAHVGRLRRIAAPALFATGALDANSTPAMSEAMAREVEGSTCEVLDGAGHMMTLTHPGRLEAVLRRWLARPARPRR